MQTEFLGFPISVIEGEIVKKGTRSKDYSSTTTTIYKNADGFESHRENSVSHFTHHFKTFSLKNDKTKVTEDVTVAISMKPTDTGNYLRIFSANDYDFAVADDTTKILYIKTSMFYEYLNRARYWIVWLSVPLMVIAGLLIGLGGVVLGIGAIPILIVLRRYTVRWTLWQSRLEFKKHFEGYKISYFRG